MAFVTSIEEAQKSVKLGNTSPYIATIGPKKVTVDYAKLKKAGVSAMMFNAGSLYDASHQKKTYLNPYLGGQVKKCLEANMPFALYATVRAKNEVEADAECRALYYILDLYPPKLGVWLHMATGQSRDTNDKIIKVYYKYIQKWGFTGRCGIYIAKDKIGNISWDDFQDKFNLWAISAMKNFKSVENKLLTPEMFEMPD